MNSKFRQSKRGGKRMNERGKRMTTTTTANGRKKGRQTGRKGLDDGSRERKKKR